MDARMFPMKTIMINNDPAVAADAQAAGVARLMVDLESHGKKERQASRTTFISTHVKEDIAPMRAAVKQAELMVRVNGWHANSREEVEYVIAQGADRIMLPMITGMAQMEGFLEIIKGRTKVLPLVETSYSMAHISTIAALPEIDDIFIGLNDLHLSLGLDFLFEPLALGILDWMAANIKAAGKTFGFGGITTMGSGELPAQRILAEHVRMGSRGVILSARFSKDVRITEPDGRQSRIQSAMDAMRAEYDRAAARSSQQAQAESIETFALIRQLALRARTTQQKTSGESC